MLYNAPCVWRSEARLTKSHVRALFAIHDVVCIFVRSSQGTV